VWPPKSIERISTLLGTKGTTRCRVTVTVGHPWAFWKGLASITMPACPAHCNCDQRLQCMRAQVRSAHTHMLRLHSLHMHAMQITPPHIHCTNSLVQQRSLPVAPLAPVVPCAPVTHRPHIQVGFDSMLPRCQTLTAHAAAQAQYFSTSSRGKHKSTIALHRQKVQLTGQTRVALVCRWPAFVNNQPPHLWRLRCQHHPWRLLSPVHLSHTQQQDTWVLEV
jgi:hypothetical protein